MQTLSKKNMANTVSYIHVWTILVNLLPKIPLTCFIFLDMSPKNSLQYAHLISSDLILVSYQPSIYSCLFLLCILVNTFHGLATLRTFHSCLNNFLFQRPFLMLSSLEKPLCSYLKIFKPGIFSYSWYVINTG